MNQSVSIASDQSVANELQRHSPPEIIDYVLGLYPDCAFSFSGAEDVVLIDMAVNLLPKGRKPVVFTLDTGRLHAETYRFIDRVREHYDLQIHVLSPDKQAVERLVAEKGLFSFYRDGHQECCSIRKVQALKNYLAGCQAWISGLREDQSPATRSGLSVVEEEATADGGKRMKFNPLLNWSSAQVWEYIRMFDVPYNELHDRGFVSIGCEPCTKPIGPNQHEREGRWWWESSTIKECGLHQKSADDKPGL